MNAQCAVFGESGSGLPITKDHKTGHFRAVMDAIAGRIDPSRSHRGSGGDVVVVGGMAKNAGFVDS
jgi:activator of 2-hydroxyglutaryl-CoA dehydratase